MACVIGDGESETGPLAGSWHSNKFLNPVTDGAVLPILHLNGYKIANPTIPARIPHEELESLLTGYGYHVYTVEGDDPKIVHEQLAAALDAIVPEIQDIQRRARADGNTERPRWPALVLRTPKGWTGPKYVDGKPVEGTWRAHQVPIAEVRGNAEHLRQLEEWMLSYRPEELFDASGALMPEIARLAPADYRRMSDNPHANGGLLLRDLDLPRFQDYAVDVPSPGAVDAEATRVLGDWLRDVIVRNGSTFRLLGPDETASNRLDPVFEATGRAFDGIIVPGDNQLAPDGRVMEVLSEHLCQGWLEGYLLTGRHGLFNCYEAFIHIIDSMFNQHAKWLKSTRHIPWRRPVASLNYLLSSLVWRQDHNGFSHQDPGFIDHVVNKKAEIIRVYLPPDANTLLSVADHCLRSRHYVNVIVAGKQPQAQWLSMDEAIIHCTRGAGIWEWASSDTDPTTPPDVVLACCGDDANAGDPGGGVAAARAPSAAQGAGGERGGPDAAAAGVRAPARHVGRRVRRAVHHHRAGDLRLPRLPVADPPADLPAARSRQLPCPRVQGGGHHHHAVRHGDAQRPGPVPPGDGRDRPDRRAGEHGGPGPPAHGGQADRVPRVHQGVRRGRAGDQGLEVDQLTEQPQPSYRTGAASPVTTPPHRVLVVNAGSSSLKLPRARRPGAGNDG